VLEGESFVLDKMIRIMLCLAHHFDLYLALAWEGRYFLLIWKK